MSFYKDLFSAIQKPIIDNAKFGLPWSFENESFNPPENSTAWARLTTLPAQPDPVEIGAVLTDEVNGLSQIDLFYPADQGKGAALSKADEILSVYQRAANLIYADAQVRVRTAGLSQGADNDPWYHVYITFEWVSYRCVSNS